MYISVYKYIFLFHIVENSGESADGIYREFLGEKDKDIIDRI